MTYKRLVARELVKRVGGRKILDGLSIEAGPGKVTGLLGPNGAGKTTAFKVILGIESKQGGEVEYGTRLDGLPLYKRARMGLGYLSQTPSVFTGLTVRENILGILQTLKVKDARNRCNGLLSKFGLETLKNQKASTLSGGERRKLEFARALCSEPGVVLVDEPFAGIDPIAAADLIKSIRALADDKTGFLITDHSVRYAFDICDKIYLIVAGRIVEQGTCGEIRKSETAKRLYLGDEF